MAKFPYGDSGACVEYSIRIAVTYKSPWYAALAGFYAWLVIIRGGIVSADKYVESRKYPANNKEKYKIVIALIGGIALISAGIAISAPIAQMAVGTYPKSGGIFNIVVNSVFAPFQMRIFHGELRTLCSVQGSCHARTQKHNYGHRTDVRTYFANIRNSGVGTRLELMENDNCRRLCDKRYHNYFGNSVYGA